MNDIYREIIGKINELQKHNKNLTIGIDGRCGSGKTTLAKSLQDELSCEVIHMDDFFVPKELKNEKQYSQVGRNYDYDRFIKEVSKNIRIGNPFYYSVYKCHIGAIVKKRYIKNSGIILIEGVYSHNPINDISYDLKIFLTIDRDTQLERLKNRDFKKFSKFIDIWIPKEEEYFSKHNIEDNSHIIIEISKI